ncbi:MAG: ZIP family metal transporter [Candidatus Nitrohelix vancouverensis]|uniref:ZIP family metal transporter n=1 Tax=Candidatus Nitrohelix vancouverensis TaxID=2705534 RepID=A0A7T0C4B2_9BACT|nr:MAG: ZIP family metal transporter [Candidatus Nitrohelix vancouverensis]
MEQASFYLFLLFVFAITMLGGWIPTVKILSKGTFRLVISFCAGVLLGAVFFHMLPEISTVLGDNLGVPIMLGFLMIFLMEKFIMVHPCEEGECDFHKVGLAAYFGIGFHSLLEGIAIGAGEMMNLSLVIFTAVAVHKFPAALALGGMLVKGGEYSKNRILVSMLIFSLATPVGALFAVSILDGLSEYALGVAIGLSAGTFLFISIGDLLPTVYEEHQGGFKNLLCMGMGILLMVLTKDIA